MELEPKKTRQKRHTHTTNMLDGQRRGKGEGEGVKEEGRRGEGGRPIAISSGYTNGSHKPC